VIEVLNLGAGVQSSAVLLMSIEGMLPKLDHAIFADTGWEPAAVYRQLEWLTAKAEDAGIKVHVVSNGDIRKQTIERQVPGDKSKGHWSSIPFYIRNPDGSDGQVRRKCTFNHKIQAVERCIRKDVLLLKHKQRAPRGSQVRQWFGISFDERRRMKVSPHKWSVFYYPLIDMKWDRVTCHNWMLDKGYPDAPRSACIGCPYRSNREWREMREQRPDEWKDAVEFDEACRNIEGMNGKAFLHSDRLPLSEVNLWTDEMPGQLRLWDDECSGMCGM
jgi:hypothetical protein